MEYVGEETLIENEGGQGEGWVETHHMDPTTMTEVEDKVGDMTLECSKAEEEEAAADMDAGDDGSDGDNDDDDAEAADMEDFEESGMLEAVDPVCGIKTLNLFSQLLMKKKILLLFFRRQQLHYRPNQK